MIRMAFALLLLVSAGSALAQTEVPDAPFGLKWGVSQEQIKSMGIVLSNESDGNFGHQAEAKKLPKVVGDADHVVLYFGNDDKLFRVVAISNEFNNDKTGIKATSRYDELKSALTERYGKGKSTEYSGGGDYMRQRDNFAYSLKTGDRYHFSTWNAEGVNIELSVRAQDMTTTYWVLIYTENELGKAYEASKKRKEKEAL